MKLLQVEFYGILSPKVKAIHAKKGRELENYPPLMRGTDEYVDLFLRSRLHGYATYDPNDVRAELEEQAIPLKSIRIPLQAGLSAAWAPNGYGKTFIFNHLQSMSQFSFGDHYAHGWDRFRNHYIVAQLELDEENRFNPTKIVPYHGLGLMVEQGEEKFAVIVIPSAKTESKHVEDFSTNQTTSASSAFIYVRKIQSADELDDDDWTESGWAYSRGNKWTEIDDLSDDSEAHLFEGHDLKTIANEAIQEFCECSIIYHETPSESEKGRFEEFLESMKPSIRGSRSTFMKDTYARWSSGELVHVPALLKNDNENPASFSELLEGLHDELLLLTDSMALHTSTFDLESRIDKFRHYIQHPYVLKMPKTLVADSAQPANLSSEAVKLRAILLNLMESHKSLASKTIWNVIKDHKNALARGRGDWEKWSTTLGLSFDVKLLDLGIETRATSVLDMLSIPYYQQLVGGNLHIFYQPTQKETSFAELLTYINKVLFSRGDFNNNLRAEAILALQSMLKEKSQVISDFGMSSMIDVLMEEYAFQTCQNNQFKRLLEQRGYFRLVSLVQSDSKYIQYRGYSIARRIIMSASENGKLSSELKHQILGNEDLTDIFYQDETLRTAQDFQKLATSKIEEGFDVLKAHLNSIDSSQEITSCSEWFLLFTNSIRREDVEFEDGVYAALNLERGEARGLIWDETDHLKVIEAYPSTLPCDFFPTLSATGINPLLLREEINRCLMPEDPRDNPWGVQVSFPLHQSSEATTPCVLFHPASVDTNTVRPEHLSFGMRSEICLQLVLSRFLHTNRQRFIENKRGVHMLVVDEPEIGRAERWVRLLIERFNRLEKQLESSDAKGSVLIVSHRNVVAERSTALGQYHIMQKIPDEVEWFDD